MTTYTFNDVAGTTLPSFDPATDTLLFSVWTSAKYLELTTADGATVVSVGIESVTLAGVTPGDLDASVFVFPGGSVLGIGGVGNDTYTGGTGEDLFLLGAGGDDAAAGGDGGDRFKFGTALTAADSIHGGGGMDEVHLAGDYAETVVLGENTIRSVERIVIGTGGTVRLQINQSLLSTAQQEVVFDGTSQTAGHALFLDAAAVTSEFQVRGGAGNDTLLGGSRDNHFEAGEGNNVVAGRAGNDYLEVNSYGKGEGNSTVLGGAGDDHVTANYSDGSNVLYGGSGSDQLYGGDGNDVLHAAGAQDSESELVADLATSINGLSGGLGNDTLYGDAGKDQLYGGENDDQLEGGGGDDSLNGGNGDDTMAGGAGNDTVVGGVGTDVMAGGEGNDTYEVRDESNVVVEQAEGGTDTVFVHTAVYTLSAHVENAKVEYNAGPVRLEGNGAANQLTGGGGNDTIVGGAGNDSLQGWAGLDRLEGGTGDDVYTTYAAEVVELAGEGIDTVLVWSDTYVLPTNVENGTLVARYDAGKLVGNSGNNVLDGGDGSCTILGGAGDDTLRGDGYIASFIGGSGNDTYEIGGRFGRVTEAAGDSGGLDVVIARVDHTLDEGVENLTLVGSATHGYGNTLDNVLRGNGNANMLSGDAGEDTMTGGGGDDEYHVDAVGDIVVEDADGGKDTVYARTSHVLGANVENLWLWYRAVAGTGNDLANVLTGNDGANVLDGQGGADTMTGGDGSDTYVVDQVGDVVKESGDFRDVDTVKVGINYTLAKDLENLELLGAEALAGTGNGRNNRLLGNDGANVLGGLFGNDSLFGAGGDDMLVGSVGDDVLAGGQGKDTLDGGGGNDTYHVDTRGDAIIEGEARDSEDLVVTTLSWTLEDFLENLTLTGTANLNGSGNELDNYLVGNDGNNRLYGGGNGFDTMAGGSGDDTYVINSASDRVVEIRTGGYDTALSGTTAALAVHVEKLVLTGTRAIDGKGNRYAETLLGNAAANELDGGGGADTLVGGAGDDTYVVGDAGDVVIELSGGGSDRVATSITLTLGANLENLTLIGREQINGTGNAVANLINGNATHNTLDGARGDDLLRGMNGDDVLRGGDGDDTLVGGAGVDVLFGEEGRDVFQFFAVRETSDIIADFTSGEDVIDLSALAGLRFIGSAPFSPKATGELRYVLNGSDLYLLGSTDADATAEFGIILQGVSTLSALDLLLS